MARIIFCNPPFYEQQLKSGNLQKDTAHHSTDLQMDDLFQTTFRLLKPGGMIYLLLPFYRTTEVLLKAGSYQLFPQETIFIKQTPSHPFFRTFIAFRNVIVEEPVKKEIIIKINNDMYSDAFTNLLKDYYLKL